MIFVELYITWNLIGGHEIVPRVLVGNLLDFSVNFVASSGESEVLPIPLTVLFSNCNGAG